MPSLNTTGRQVTEKRRTNAPVRRKNSVGGALNTCFAVLIYIISMSDCTAAEMSVAAAAPLIPITGKPSLPFIKM